MKQILTKATPAVNIYSTKLYELVVIKYLQNLLSELKFNLLQKDKDMQVVDYGLSEEQVETLFTKNDYSSHVLLITAIAIFAKLLYAPFQYIVTNSFITNAGYSFILSPPTSSIHFNSVNLIATVNILQLAIEILTILLVGALVRQWFINHGNVRLSAKSK